MRAVLAIVCMAALAATGACASDINFGATARSTAMGGAGIALGDDSGTTTMLNPAAPACAGARFRFIFPGLDFHTTGATFSDLADSLSKASGGNTSDALDLVDTFASQRTTLNLNAMTGFAGTFGVTLEAQGNAMITPSPEVPKWVAAGQLLESNQTPDLFAIQATIDNTHFDDVVTDLTASVPNLVTAQADLNLYLNDLNQNYVDANVAYGPGFLLGRGFSTANGTMWLGTNLKVLYSQSKRWWIHATQTGPIAPSGSSFTVPLSFSADEIDANGAIVTNSTAKTTSLKADVGMIYKPNGSMWQYGVVANNFIKPNVKGLTNTQDEMMLSGGIAAVLGRNFVLAADLVNLTGANGEKAKLRMGGELRLGRMFAARMGYSGSEWTTGFELLGLNISWAGSGAQLLSNVLKF